MRQFALMAGRIASVIVVVLLMANPAHGQQAPDSLRQKFKLPVPRLSDALLAPRSAPAMGASSPSAFGGVLGDIWGGATWTNRPRFATGQDGVASGGFALGDPYRFLGLDVDIISFTTVRERFLLRGAVDFEISRYLGRGFAIAAGYESAIHWGFQDTGPSRYGTVSKWLVLNRDDSAPFSAILFTVGAGNGRFLSEADENAGKKKINPFGSIGIRLAGPLSIVGDWTGQDLYVGGSLAPFKRHQLVLSAGATDLTHSAGDGTRFVVSGGFSLNFLGR
ncbi:MAG: hypothetical protein JST65_18900 [Acidobacteria bacterium]|nr:hypothetical protein [Acidobacteriota bacterium]